MRSDKNHLRGLPREQVPEALKAQAQAQAEQGARVKVVLAMSVPWFRKLRRLSHEALQFVYDPIAEYATLRNWLDAVGKAVREAEQAPEGAGFGTAPFHWDAANGGVEARVERVDDDRQEHRYRGIGPTVVDTLARPFNPTEPAAEFVERLCQWLSGLGSELHLGLNWPLALAETLRARQKLGVDPIPSEAEQQGMRRWRAEPRRTRVPSPRLPQAAERAVERGWQAAKAAAGMHLRLTGVVSITPQQWSEAFLEAERETAHRFREATCLMANRDGQMECPLCYFEQRMRARLGILDPEFPGAAP